MSTNSKIEWTQTTWNPVTGCTKVSSGCKNCYAERLAKRLKAMGQPNYRNGFTVTTHEHMLNIPYKWKKPRLVFVNSMSDLFHEDVPFEFIQKVFGVMSHADHHIFQVLTKRSERLLETYSELPWPNNIWMGVTVEDESNVHRITHLKDTPAKIKFLSFEPLLEQIQSLDLYGIDWVIVGGESGPQSRTMLEEWVEGIHRNCIAKDIPFFFKQWGGVNKKKNGRLFDGRTWDEMPTINKEV